LNWQSATELYKSIQPTGIVV